MTITITPLQSGALPALQALWDKQLFPNIPARLADALQDAAHDHGRQVVVAWRNDQLAGCAGWVTLGIAHDGCAYAAPVVAIDDDVASHLIQTVMETVRNVGAQRLRISAYLPEVAKHKALKTLGFTPLFEFFNLVLPLPLESASPLPAELHAVPFAQINWEQARALFAETFVDVPNSPIPAVAAIREEWELCDWQAGRVLADRHGEYQAFSLIQANSVEAVGVRSAWRGQNLAATLYRIAAESLLRSGHSELCALVAGSNVASMRFHQKLGFQVVATPRTVYELAIATEHNKFASSFEESGADAGSFGI
ncbi:GNAT family N-acetyltransferase [Silvimonas sp.]|uniref:GNAT family N-acetyltransferase n=1 Tax=Silvimonas sp. TaxID=2650811 RepID=UPI00283B9E85|nr:GNAT family N-acetyltransferase [Silvimonas sp.]MDR3428191.1 GNAT family N-acetyltransferase [Silvimonas sp.]